MIENKIKKDLKVLQNKSRIQEAINNLDRNKIHIIYFSYYLNWHNFCKNVLLLTTKLLNFVTKKPSIDHVAHISRFVFDKDAGCYEAKIFEATMEMGMEQNDLFGKLKLFQGICYIETLDVIVDRVKAKQFEKDYTGVPYSKQLAVDSGIDIGIIDDSIHIKTDGGFCSWLESLFLLNQNIDISRIENGDVLEITPADIYLGNLGEKKILYQY